MRSHTEDRRTEFEEEKQAAWIRIMEFFGNLGQQQYNGDDNEPENAEEDEGFVEGDMNQAKHEPIDAEEWAQDNDRDREWKENINTEQEAGPENQRVGHRHAVRERGSPRTKDEDKE